MPRVLSLLTLASLATVLAFMAGAAPPERVGVYISTGDNHWLGLHLPVDSPAAIADTFDMLKAVHGADRIYWRGLQEATAVETMHVRPENFRYATAFDWFRHLIVDCELEKTAVQLAHERGMELWGVGTLGDWGAPADTPGFGDFPSPCEAKLRLEHPDWVPVDRYGYRRQGGPLELAYPEARKALVELHTRLARQAGYDGIIFLTYVECFSQRFEDEFGFNEPVVTEFEKRFGADPRAEGFSKYASRYDWARLRGEYVTEYLRELKQALGPHGIKLGMMVDPQRPSYPMTWATLPQTYATLGRVHMDLGTWIRESIVDLLVVYGGCDRRAQARTLADCLWMARGTSAAAAFVTSGLTDPVWNTFQAEGVESVLALGTDAQYLERSSAPDVSKDALNTGTAVEKMKFLSQVLGGKSSASVEMLRPLVGHDNVILRRLALLALGKTGNSAAVPLLEAALNDPENAVRCAALGALGDNHAEASCGKILAALDRHGNHPLWEVARITLTRIRPFPRAELTRAAGTHANPMVRVAALRALAVNPISTDVALLRKSLDDSCRYARYVSAKALGSVRGDSDAVDALIAATAHDDVAVANRAATSLGQMARRGLGNMAARRTDMLSALRTLFGQAGDGCARTDADWGYRAVGDGLLNFGEDGEAILSEFMSQDDDKRLAELAWRVLHLREKAGDNRFNIVAEKDNEAAFSLRPSHLPRLRAQRLAQSFEDRATFPEGLAATTGDANRRSGRWSGFGPKGAVVSSARAPGGTRCIKLVRGGQALSGWVTNGVTSECDAEVEMRVWRESTGAFVLVVKAGGGDGKPVSVFVAPDGSLAVPVDGTSSPWQATDLVVQTGVWTQLRLEISRREQSLTVEVLPEGGAARRSQAVSGVWAGQRLSHIGFYPQPPQDGVCYIDDVALVEKR